MQLALDYEPEYAGAILPRLGTQHRTLLDAFYRGERLSVLQAIQRYGVYALSQRCGQLKRLGWPIKSRTIESGGKHFSEYWVDFT
jgi:hypothetical protein